MDNNCEAFRRVSKRQSINSNINDEAVGEPENKVRIRFRQFPSTFKARAVFTWPGRPFLSYLVEESPIVHFLVYPGLLEDRKNLCDVTSAL